MAAHEASAQAGGGSGSATATTGSLGVAAAGDLIVATVGWYLGTFVSVTDSVGGNTWTQVGTELSLGGGSSQSLRVYYSVLSAGGSGFTVTFTASSTGTYPTIVADRFSGSAFAADVTAGAEPDTSNASGSTGATSTRGAATTVMVAGFSTAHTSDITFTEGNNVAWALGGAYGTGSASCPVAQEWFIASSAGTDAGEMSWTSANPWAGRIAVFTFSGGGGGGDTGLAWLRA